MKNRLIALFAVLVTLLSLAACGKKPDVVVYVQNVGEIVGAGSIALNDKFAGVVVSENATKVSRDYSRTVSMLYVSEGQDVRKGDVLFTYDSEALELEVDKQKLELERLQQSSTTLKTQITQLKNDMKKASKDDQLNYTINIQEKEAALKENEYNITLKKREIAQTQSTLSNAQVTAPISGRIISISKEDYDNDGAYITIQQAGTYRVKASLNELNRGMIFEGTQMRITSRNNDGMSWEGVVSLIDTEGGSTGNSDQGYYGPAPDEYSSTTKYPFYVELKNAEGLMLGQHVFVEVDNGTAENEAPKGLMLPEYYLTFEEGVDEAKAFVWADNGKDRLEKRYVTLGVYDDMNCTYEIVEGLTEDDFIAFPDDLCAVGVGTTRNPEEVQYGENQPGGEEWNGDFDVTIDDFIGDESYDDSFADENFSQEPMDEIPPVAEGPTTPSYNGNYIGGGNSTATGSGSPVQSPSSSVSTDGNIVVIPSGGTSSSGDIGG